MLLKLNVVAAAVVALSAGFASAQTVVTIAHVGPTSGAIAHLGKDNENGAKMAVEELNAAGVTIGGKETLTSAGSIPDDAWVLSRDAFSNPRAPERHVIHFEQGRPCGLDGRAMAPVEVIEQLELLAGPFGIGRGIHLGDTIIGTKGRVAFEAPAAEVLLNAHRELEKLVLTGRQQRIKEMLAGPYGDWVHEGQLLDPVCRDIEALMLSSQERVTGTVNVLFRPGAVFVEGVESDYSLMAASKGVYGEATGEWTAADALGFSRIVGLTGVFHRRAGERAAGK